MGHFTFPPSTYATFTPVRIKKKRYFGLLDFFVIVSNKEGPKGIIFFSFMAFESLAFLLWKALFQTAEKSAENRIDHYVLTLQKNILKVEN